MSRKKKEKRALRRKEEMRRKAAMHKAEAVCDKECGEYYAHRGMEERKRPNFHRPINVLFYFMNKHKSMELQFADHYEEANNYRTRRDRAAMEQQIHDFPYEEELMPQELECAAFVCDIRDVCVCKDVHLMMAVPRKRCQIRPSLMVVDPMWFGEKPVVAVSIPLKSIAKEEMPKLKPMRVRPGGRVERTMADPDFFVKKEPAPFEGFAIDGMSDDFDYDELGIIDMEVIIRMKGDI